MVCNGLPGQTDRTAEKLGPLRESLSHAVPGDLDDPFAKKNGRSGQAQHGVDIFGRPHGVGSEWVGVQCKGKEEGYGAKASLPEFKSELAKAEGFTPSLTRWIFATTSPSDAILQKACREIAQQRSASGKFDVEFLSWDDIQSLLAERPSVLRDFYPEHAFNIPGILERLEALPTGRTSVKGVAEIARRSSQTDEIRELGCRSPSTSIETWGQQSWEGRWVPPTPQPVLGFLRSPPCSANYAVGTPPGW